MPLPSCRLPTNKHVSGSYEGRYKSSIAAIPYNQVKRRLFMVKCYSLVRVQFPKRGGAFKTNTSRKSTAQRSISGLCLFLNADLVPCLLAYARCADGCIIYVDGGRRRRQRIAIVIQAPGEVGGISCVHIGHVVNLLTILP